MRNIKTIFASLYILGGTFCSQAQTIQLDFPKFANKKYVYVLIQGDQKDTISKGNLDQNGKTTLEVPVQYKDFKGMSQWMLTDGGGLDMILNKESYRVGSPSEEPNEDNIVYEGSKENFFLINQFKEQELLMNKTELLRMTVQHYDVTEVIYPTLKAELEKQEAKLVQFEAQTLGSTLYAARFREIADFVGETGIKRYKTEEERSNDLVRFVSDKVDFEELYTSGHWSTLISNWFNGELLVVQDDKQLLKDSKNMLTRVKTEKVYNDLAQKLVVYYTKFGKDLLLKELALFIKEQGRLTNKSWTLQRMAYGQMGTVAPAIVRLKKPIEIGKGKRTILLFYQTGCGNCEKELTAMKENFTKLKEKNIRLISIAADGEKEMYEYAIQGFPWPEKIWDEEMFEGANFKNYGIIGTPTYILIDGEGKITGRYASFTEINLLE